MGRNAALKLARHLVVATGNWPVLGAAYRTVYAQQIRRVTRAFGHWPDLEAVVLRGSTVDDLRPGLSDIDLVVVLPETLSPGAEVDVVARFGQVVDRLNRWAPLIRDVHIVTPDELRAWNPTALGLLGAIAARSQHLVGNLVLPPLTAPRSSVVDTMIRDSAWWLAAAMRQLIYQPDRVGRLLAARSLHRAMHCAQAAEDGAADFVAIQASVSRDFKDRAASWTDVLQAHRRLDKLLPEAPEVDDAASSAPHPGVAATAAWAARWVAPLRDLPALDAVVLSVEGAGSHDLRLYLSIDPDHPAALAALHRIAAHARSVGPFPEEHFLRFAHPLVVTRKQLARSIYLRWTATEPWLRLKWGRVLHGTPPPPRATLDELGRALASHLGRTGCRARELVRLRRDPVSCPAPWADLVHGLLPACRDYVEQGRLCLEGNATPASPSTTAESEAEGIWAPFAEVRSATRTLLPRLVARAYADIPSSTPS